MRARSGAVGLVAPADEHQADGEGEDDGPFDAEFDLGAAERFGGPFPL
jgi:hypothetical protein